MTPRQGTPEVLDALLRGKWDVVEAAPEQVLRQASQLVVAHVQWHTERSLHTLPLLAGEGDVRRHTGTLTGNPNRKDHSHGASA